MRSRCRLIRNEGRHPEFGKGDIGIHMGTLLMPLLLLFRNLDTPAPVGKPEQAKKKRGRDIGFGRCDELTQRGEH